MSQTPYVGAPQGAVWGFDPTTSLWLPVGISPKLVAANGEEYASMLVWVSNGNPNGQATMVGSAPVAIASDQPGLSQLATGDTNPIANSLEVAIGLANGPNAARWVSWSSVNDNYTNSGAGVIANMALNRYNPNGAGVDYLRNNLDNIAVIPSASYTTTQISADMTNFNHRGLIVALDVTIPGTGSITLEIDGKDPVSGKYYTILTGLAVTTISTPIYRVYPGLAASANASANDMLPRTWRVKVTANNANPVTYSAGSMLVV